MEGGIIITWVILALVIGLLGNNRKIGFAGAFFLSLLLSPLIGLIITLCSKDKEDEAYKAQMLETQKKQQETLNKVQETVAVGNVTQELERLKKLKDEGVLNDDEFDTLKKKALEGLKANAPEKPKITFEDKPEKVGDEILHHLTYNDGTEGIVYEKISSKSFAINADNSYVFYKDKEAAARALYIFIKFSKLSTKDRIQ